MLISAIANRLAAKYMAKMYCGVIQVFIEDYFALKGANRLS